MYEVSQADHMKCRFLQSLRRDAGRFRLIIVKCDASGLVSHLISLFLLSSILLEMVFTISASCDFDIAQYSSDYIETCDNDFFAGSGDAQEDLSMIYRQALVMMYSGNFQKAAICFQKLNGFRLSEAHQKYSESRVNEGNVRCMDYLRNCTGKRHVGAGTWFDLPLYILYLPDHIDAKTRCVLYFPGGNGEMEDASGTPVLFAGSVYQYLDLYSPSGIMVFMRSSGFSSLTPTIDLGYQVLEGVARDNGIALHGIVAAGSSMGGYTALKAAAYLYETYGVPVSSVLVYDMGMDFEVPVFPNETEYADIARSRTRMYFFEQKGFKLEKEELKTMIDKNIEVHVVWCVRDEHNVITTDGFSQGTISWAIGEGQDLNSANYIMVS